MRYPRIDALTTYDDYDNNGNGAGTGLGAYGLKDGSSCTWCAEAAKKGIPKLDRMKTQMGNLSAGSRPLYKTSRSRAESDIPPGHDQDGT